MTSPALAVSLVVLLLGLVGTPPTGVFVGKVTVFAAAWDGGFAWLVVVAVINTVASLFYYLRWIGPAFDRSPAPSSAATDTVAARPDHPDLCRHRRGCLGDGRVAAGLVLGLDPVLLS